LFKDKQHFYSEFTRDFIGIKTKIWYKSEFNFNLILTFIDTPGKGAGWITGLLGGIGGGVTQNRY
jgi:hypothetical protein